MPEYSSPLGMPINTGDSEHLVKSEEHLAGCLYENKIKEFSITVPVKQPTSHSCASRLFAFCQLAIFGSPIGCSRQTANLIIGHNKTNIAALTIVSTFIDHRKYFHLPSKLLALKNCICHLNKSSIVTTLCTRPAYSLNLSP